MNECLNVDFTAAKIILCLNTKAAVACWKGWKKQGKRTNQSGRNAAGYRRKVI